MKRMYIMDKTSAVIDHLKTVGYSISPVSPIYGVDDIEKISEMVEDTGAILLIRRSDCTELMTGEDTKLRGIDKFTIMPVEDLASSSTDRVVTRMVVDSLKRSGINNPDLIEELEDQCDDEFTDEIMIEGTFVLEPTKGEPDEISGHRNSTKSKRDQAETNSSKPKLRIPKGSARNKNRADNSSKRRKGIPRGRRRKTTDS